MAGKGMRTLKNSIQERMTDMVKFGTLTQDSDGDFLIRDAQWSDYSGATYTRANAIVLARDYSDVVSMGRGAHGWEYAWISKSVLNDGPCVGTPDIAERVAYVLDIIDGLTDYPVIDDEAVSEVEQTILEEAWENYGRWDFTRTVCDRDEKACVMCQAFWNNIGPQCELGHDMIDEDTAFESFCRVTEGHGFTATDVDMRDHIEEAVAYYENTLMTREVNAELERQMGGLF